MVQSPVKGFQKKLIGAEEKKENTEVLVKILSPSNVISGCEYCYFKYIHVETYFVNYFFILFWCFAVAACSSNNVGGGVDGYYQLNTSH